MQEEKAEHEKRHYRKISRNQCERDKIRIAKPKAVRNVRMEAPSETSADDLRKKPFTLLKSDLKEAFCMPSSKRAVSETGRETEEAWHC